LQEGKLAKEVLFISKGALKIAGITDKGNEVINFCLS
jgi:hypothetical protein